MIAMLRYCTRTRDRFDISLTDSITRAALNSRTCLHLYLLRHFESAASKWIESYITFTNSVFRFYSRSIVVSVTRYIRRIIQVVELYREKRKETQMATIQGIFISWFYRDYSAASRSDGKTCIRLDLFTKSSFISFWISIFSTLF